METSLTDKNGTHEKTGKAEFESDVSVLPKSERHSTLTSFVVGDKELIESNVSVLPKPERHSAPTSFAVGGHDGIAKGTKI
jgi:hypothetical protein